MLRNSIIVLVLAASFVMAERGLAVPQEQATTRRAPHKLRTITARERPGCVVRVGKMPARLI